MLLLVVCDIESLSSLINSTLDKSLVVDCVLPTGLFSLANPPNTDVLISGGGILSNTPSTK